MIRKGIQSGPRRCVLYGTAGIGKTTWGCSAPDPILIPVEDNGGVVATDSYPQPKSFPEVIMFLRDAYKQDAYKTVVVDSLDWIERLIWKRVCEAHSVDSIEGIGYGKGYVEALTYWRELLSALDALRAKGKTIVCLAHAAIVKYTEPGTDGYDRFQPKLHKAASALVTEWCDELFFASYEIFVSKEKGALKNKATGDGTRLVHTVETPAYVAKNRLRISQDIPLDFGAYMKYWPQIEVKNEQA